MILTTKQGGWFNCVSGAVCVIALSGCATKVVSVPLKKTRNVVVDFGSDSGTVSFAQMQQDGIACILHRARTADGDVDDDYNARAQAAADARFRWGAYGFLTAGDPKGSQTKEFLSLVADEAQQHQHTQAPVILALDTEGKSRLPLPELAHQAEIVHAVTGRYPGLYVNSLEFKNDAAALSWWCFGTRRTLAKCWLWGSSYSLKSAQHPDYPVGLTVASASPGTSRISFEVPTFSKTWTLWQYTGDNDGYVENALEDLGYSPELKGFVRGGREVRQIGSRPSKNTVDRSLFNASNESFDAFWKREAVPVSEWKLSALKAE